MHYQLAPKPAFMDQLLTINPADVRKIFVKVNDLQNTPQPDSKNKKRLRCGPDLYRLRVGEYRVVYTFGDDGGGNGYVSLLGVDKRDDVYDDCREAEGPGFDLAAMVDGALGGGRAGGAHGGGWAGPGQDGGQGRKRPADSSNDLPIKFTDDLLDRLRVPDEYREAVKGCKSIDDLIEAEIPEALRERLFNIAVEPDWERRRTEPDYVIDDSEDLIRFAEGELIAFLLKLDPEQQALVRRAVDGAGPMLVKGGPGTGKSTIALYRTKEVIAALRRAGVERPRVLFTTYTNALTAASRQQLEQLLGEDAALVDVRTADSVAREVLIKAGVPFDIANSDRLRRAMNEALASVKFEGNALTVQAQEKTVERLGVSYLEQEIQSVIEGRGIGTLAEYQAASRSGRGVPLGPLQREAVWRVREALQVVLGRNDELTWSMLRRRAAEIAAAAPAAWDAVLVDEAQDLDPVLLRMLVDCCRTPDRVFITADANQSIYGSGFRWSDVHAGLQFRGRTGVLRTNHRSTPQIDRAARSYLEKGLAALDETEATMDGDAGGSVQVAPSGSPLTYARADGPPPIVRSAEDGHELAMLLGRFIREASRGWRMGVGACAVLAPTEERGKQIAAWLNEQGIAAEFMSGRELDLGKRAVKVITLKSAKGLEFPFVAIAGFEAGYYPAVPTAAEAGALEEALARERRSIYVGMTRAMLALLVAVPPRPRPPVDALYRGFDPGLWSWEPRARGNGAD